MLKIKAPYWWLRLVNRGRYAIVDPADNSLTFSRRLLRSLHLQDGKENYALMFRVSSTGLFAFVANPEGMEGADLRNIQINQRLGTVGFETPAVQRIYHEYGLPVSEMSRMRVFRRKSGKIVYYEIQKLNRVKASEYDQECIGE